MTSLDSLSLLHSYWQQYRNGRVVNSALSKWQQCHNFHLRTISCPSSGMNLIFTIACRWQIFHSLVKDLRSANMKWIFIIKRQNMVRVHPLWCAALCLLSSTKHWTIYDPCWVFYCSARVHDWGDCVAKCPQVQSVIKKSGVLDTRNKTFLVYKQKVLLMSPKIHEIFRCLTNYNLEVGEVNGVVTVYHHRNCCFTFDKIPRSDGIHCIC